MPDEASSSPLIDNGEDIISSQEAQPPAATNDDLSDVRERIRRRAQELNLQKNDATPDEYDANAPKNLLEQIADKAMDEAEIERLGAQYSDGLNIFEGAMKEFKLVEWPTPQETLQSLGIVLVIATIAVGYVLLLDRGLQFALDPLFHYSDR